VTPPPIALLAVVKQTVTWVRVEKPSFDLVGVLLSSLGVTAALIVLALAVGAVIGLLRVRRVRSQEESALDRISLHLNQSA
jgi:hypothetical protein